MTRGPVPVDSTAFAALLALIWPGVPEVIEQSRRLGVGWEAASLHFVETDDTGAWLAHVGVLPLSIMLAGKLRAAAGFHSVCTRPSHQGRGLFSALMDTAVAYCSARFAPLVLFADAPARYTRWDFHRVSESHFALAVSAAGPSSPPMRRLSHRTSSDVALAQASVETRVPASDTFSIGAGWPLFAFNELQASHGFARLYEASDLGVLVAYEIAAGTLRLFDVVGPWMPTLAEILARVPQPFSRVEIHFTPDQWPELGATPLPSRAPDSLMVRGPFAPGTLPLCVSPLARL